MNGLDWIMIGILIGSVLMGFQRGFVWQLIHLIGFVAAYFIAFWFYKDLAPVVSEWIPFPDLSRNTYLYFFDASSQLRQIFYSAVAFGLLFFGSKLFLNIIGHVAHGIASLPVLSFVNRWMGGILSFVETALIIIILVNIAVSLPVQKVHEFVAGSFISGYILEQSPVLTEKLQGLWQEYKGDFPSPTEQDGKEEFDLPEPGEI